MEVGADGGLRAIRLTEHGRRLDPDTLVAVIVRLHAAALTESRTAVAQAVAELEADPRLRLRGAQIMDALRQPVPRGEVEVRGRPDRPAASRQPTPEEEDEMDRYYQRKSWLV
ncbi:hypothetical protein [Nocardia sp. alder85J]|uniref:hypothetical protein n=1 Tax=Nocardia sp. alder85J TaxID=2862949 RepID=UPI001CD440E7|nr:hypothetical protein [Nocardia sp. alder85J]MCX4093970.1 hypothetical protein [Nocardia sp. alder85J]